MNAPVNANEIITDETSLMSKKYKTVGELKMAPKVSFTQVLARMKSGKVREYLCKWLFDKYPSEYYGNLTTRIRKLNTKPTYNHIITQCFDNIDPTNNFETFPILDCYCKNIINSLHNINPSATGVFMDYLGRRIINELRQEEFIDSRAQCRTNLKALSVNANKIHKCKLGCKTKMNEGLKCKPEPIILKECIFPDCQNLCYYKMKYTTQYKTQDILQEIFITSCCHSEAFGGCPSQDSFDKILRILNSVNVSRFISPLVCLFTSLLFDSKKILLNPGLGSMTSPIPSDCDVVIDDTLIDIKCTHNNKTVYEILQLLGYSSLLRFNETYNLRINNICILNLLKGECTIYNIESILDANLFDYLNLLTNNYDSQKQLITRTIEQKIAYPQFVDMIKTANVEISIQNVNAENAAMKTDVESIVTSHTGSQSFAEGNTHCILEPIRAWAEEKLKKAKSEHSIKVYTTVNNHIKKFLIRFKEGIPEEELQYVCDKLRIHLIVKFPYGGVPFIDITPSNKVLGVFKFINVKLNHVIDRAVLISKQINVSIECCIMKRYC